MNMEDSEKYKQIVLQLKELTIEELDDLIDVALEERTEKFEEKYKTVEVFPGSRIETQIKKETGFHCYHKACKGYSSGRGTHVIVIPKEKYSESLKQTLLEKYDSL